MNILTCCDPCSSVYDARARVALQSASICPHSLLPGNESTRLPRETAVRSPSVSITSRHRCKNCTTTVPSKRPCKVVASPPPGPEDRYHDCWRRRRDDCRRWHAAPRQRHRDCYMPKNEPNPPAYCIGRTAGCGTAVKVVNLGLSVLSRWINAPLLPIWSQ